MGKDDLIYSRKNFQVRSNRHLIGHIWTPQNPPKRLIIFQHGFGDHSLRYSNLIEFLDDKETAFAGLDAVGHGQSPGSRGHVQHIKEYAEDLGTFIDTLDSAEFENLPFLLFGHSLGGVIAADYLIHHKNRTRIEKVILSSPAFEVVMDLSKYVKSFVARRLSHVLPALAVNAGSLSHLISRDSKVVQAYNMDPLCHNKVSFSMAVSLLDVKERIFPEIDKFQTPVLITHGTGDKICHYSGSQAFYDLLKIEEKELRLLSNYYHETFNEPKPYRDEVLKTFKDFYDLNEANEKRASVG